MKEQAQNFVSEYSSKTTIGDLNEMISKFEKLSIEEQYKILCDDARKYEGRAILPQGNLSWSYLFTGDGRKNRGIGIIEILNNKFPEGITMLASPERCEIPQALYRNLISYQPDEVGGRNGWTKLVEDTSIFKDENGEIDSKKIVDYLSNPDVDFRHRDYNLIFDHLDPDEDRKRNNENYRRKTSIKCI